MTESLLLAYEIILLLLGTIFHLQQIQTSYIYHTLNGTW